MYLSHTKPILYSLILCLMLSHLTTYAQEEAKRYLLIEEFTNTFCPTCIDKHPEFTENVLNAYEDVELFHIAYHHSTPLPQDIFYWANQVEEDERAAYYTVAGTPTVHIWGEKAPRPIYVDDPLVSQDIIQERLQMTSPISVDVVEEFDENQRSVEVKVNMLSSLAVGNIRLRAVVVEKFIEYEPPHEGMETEVSNVFRQTLNGWAGNAFISIPAGNSLTYQYEYTIDSTWNADEIYVIAFLQDDNTKEVYNVGSSWGKITETPEIILPDPNPDPQEEEEEEEENEEENEEEEDITNVATTTLVNAITIYPNPVADQLHIALPLTLQADVIAIRLFNVSGQLIFSSKQQRQINMRDFQKGIYFVSIETKEETMSRKIVKVD